MATITYGGVIVPILADFNPVDITHIVNHSDAELLFTTENIWEHITPESLHSVKGVISLGNKPSLLHHKEGLEVDKKVYSLRRCFNRKYKGGFTKENIKYAQRSNAELIEINYTSGTTGFSKGVMLSANNLAGNVVFGLSQNVHWRGSRCLSFLPLAHAYGCAFDLLTTLAAGSHVTILGKLPSPRVLVKAFSEVKPHLVLCVPLVLEKIYKNKILPMISKGAIKFSLRVPLLDSVIYSRIRKALLEAFGGCVGQVIVGGAPINPEVEEFLHRIKFPFTVGYGMTECGPLISYTFWKDFIPGSAGRTLDTMESIVLSENPEKVAGEVCVRGENVMMGYYKNPEATNEVLQPDGWFKTGDMGTRAADGTLYLRGRCKTMFLSASGQNVYPEEIESKLNSMPFVAESLIVERYKKLVALVYPDYEAMDSLNIPVSELDSTMENVRKEVNKLLASYEQISQILLVPNEFEKTPKKSIKRFLYS
jgi:long-chain acyl-CoA synthetase